MNGKRQGRPRRSTPEKHDDWADAGGRHHASVYLREDDGLSEILRLTEESRREPTDEG